MGREIIFVFYFCILLIKVSVAVDRYIGDSLTLDEYKNLKHCNTKWCISDANRIIQDMSLNATEPCHSFKEFVCGTFLKHRAYNERYDYVGFMKNYELKIDEKRHKVLTVPITETDGKVVKVAKNFYQKCVNSSYITWQSKQEVLDYLASFGKFPLLSSNWTEADLNFTKLINEMKIEMFINMKVRTCPDIETREDVFCMVPIKYHTWERYRTTSNIYTAKDVKDMFRLMKISFNDVDELIYGFSNASVTHPVYADDLFDSAVKPKRFTELKISDLKDILPSLGFNENWWKIINSQLPKWIHATENARIMIKDLDIMVERIEFLKKIPKRQLANIIMVEAFYEYRNFMDVYPFTYNEQKVAIKTPQRFEICNALMETYLKPPSLALFARRFFANEIKVEAEKFMKEAFDFAKEEQQQFNFSTIGYKLDINEFIAGYPSDLISDRFLDAVYGNLSLVGNESLFETYRELWLHKKFISLVELNDDDLLTLKIASASGRNVFSCMNVKIKYLYCPATALQYPIFHPKRSVFYNMALLLPEIFSNIGFSYNLGMKFDMAFRMYLKWIEKNGQEPSLPSFRMTNEEMFWIALQNMKCYKGKQNVVYDTLFSEHGFWETFKCPSKFDDDGKFLTTVN